MCRTFASASQILRRLSRLGGIRGSNERLSIIWRISVVLEQWRPVYTFVYWLVATEATSLSLPVESSVALSLGRYAGPPLEVLGTFELIRTLF